MALYRPTPTCPHCGVVIAKGIYRNQSHLPPMQRLIGDTFMGWEYFEHTCPGKEEFERIMQQKMDQFITDLDNKDLPSFIKKPKEEPTFIRKKK